MMKAFSFLTILESLSKKLSILRTKMHSDDLRVNHGTITRLSRVSRPFSHCASRCTSFGLSRRASHFAAILTILFTIGVGNVWGEELIKVTLSGEEGGTQTITGTLSGTAAVSGLKNSSAPYKLNKSGAYVSVTLTSGNFLVGDVVTITGANKAHLVYAGTPGEGVFLGESNYSNTIATFTLPNTLPASTSTIYVYRPNNNPEGTTLGTPNGTITTLAVTRESSSSGGGECTEPTITFNNGSYTVGGSALDLSTLFDSNSNGTVTYTVTNANGTGATNNGTSFTATAAGTATVKATQAANGDYCSGEATATITVNAASGGGNGDCYSNLAYSGEANMPSGWTIVSNEDPKPQINDNTIAMQRGSDYAYSSGAPTRGMYFDANQNATISITSYCTNSRAFCLVEKNGDNYSIIQTWDAEETLTASIVSGRTYYLTSKAGSKDAAKCNIKVISFSDCASTPEPETYSITYECDGAISGCPSNTTEQTALPNPLPSAPTKTGYTFVGWYTDAAKTIPAVAGATLTADITLYAKWNCTAPTSVTIDGSWDRFGGETISLTATATGGSGGSGNYTYQWQKKIGDNWNNIEDNATATTANLVYENCDGSHSGTYRCVVSTGTDCSTASAGLQVKVYTLECYNNGTNIYHFTRNGNTQSGTLTLNLNANTAYKFKVHVDNDYYGNGGTINKDETNWVLGAELGTPDLTVNSGLGGTFTFTVDYSESGNSSTLGVPEISVTYPRKTIYLNPGVWNADGAKYAIYYFIDGHNAWSDLLVGNACGTYTTIPQWNGVTMVAVRLSSDAAGGTWDKKWNQTGNIPVNNNDYIAITGWGDGDSPYTYTTYTPATYSITFNANGGTGSMPIVTGITCGGSATLTQNTFTRTGYTFDGWATAADGTGTSYADKATISNITSNITLYAKWNAKTTTITLSSQGGTGGTASVTATYNSSTIASITNPTRECYTFEGWYSGDNGTGSLVINTTGVLQANVSGYTGTNGVWIATENKTLYAKWTKNATTLLLQRTGSEATPAGGVAVGGDAGTLNCIAEQGTIASYQWKQNTRGSKDGAVNAVGEGATTANFSPKPTAAGSYWYYCVATDECGNEVETSLSGCFLFKALYTVTFNPNNGSVDPTSATQAEAGAAITLPTPTWDGHTFAGWYTAASGGTKIGDAGASYAPTADITIYAQWETPCVAPTNAVINGGGTYNSGSNITLTVTANNITNGTTTYTWYRSNSGQEAAITAGPIQEASTNNTYVINSCVQSDAQVYYCLISNGDGCNAVASTSIAINVVTTYTLTYDANAGTDEVANMPEPEQHTPGTYTLSDLVPTRTGYTFAGWNRNPEGTGDNFNAAGQFTTGALNETLYAKWTPEPYNIYYYEAVGEVNDISGLNEISIVGAPTSYTILDAVALPALPDKDGYTATGWYNQWCVFENIENTQYWAGCEPTTGHPAGYYGHANYIVKYTATGDATDCPSSGTLYTAVAAATENISIAANTTDLELNVSTHKTTVTGGSMYVTSQQGNAKNLITSTGFVMTNNNTFFKISMDCELQEGDIISIEVGKDEANERGVWVSSATSRPNSKPDCALTATNASLIPVTYTVTESDEYNGKKVLYIYRATANTTYFNNINISRPVTCTTPAAPTSPTNGETTSNSQAVSWTDASNDAWEVYLSTSSSTPGEGQSPTAEPTTASYTFTGLTASTTYYWWVRSVCDASHKSAWVAGSSFTTTSAPAELTAIEANVLYQAADMANITFTGSDQWFAGLSTNAKFKTYGDGSSTSAKGKTVSSTSITDDIDTKNFTSIAYIMTADNTSSSSDPTKGAIEFITPSTAGYLYLYFENTSSALTLKKKGTSTSTSLSGAKYKKVAVEANTHYFINGAGSNRGLYGIKYVSTVAQTYTVTINSTTNGTVAADKTTGVAQGETVTLTVTPASGYELETLTVKDASDNDVIVTDNTFIMPASNVTVSATFTAIETPEPGTETCITFGSNDSKDIKSDGTATVGNYTITADEVNWQSDNAKLDNNVDYIVFTNSTGIIAANITAKSNAVVVTYSSSIDGTTNVTTEEVAATDQFAERTLNVPNGTKYIKLQRKSGSSIYVSQVCLTEGAALSSCTTPGLEDLSAQIVCPGEDVTWTANNTAPLADGETIAYQWTKKGNATILSETATLTLTGITEAAGGTYVVTATVSADGKASKTASKEVTLTVRPATATPTITANANTIYKGNSVTLTATCASSEVGYQWYTCNDAEGNGESEIGEAENAEYTFTAGEAGTYYYKVIVTGDGTHSCGTAEKVYALVVSAAIDASDCTTYFWFPYAEDATTNKVTNNENNFFGNSPKEGSSNSSTYKFELDGTTYTATRNTGSAQFTISFTVPENSIGTMAINCKGSSKPLYLKHTDDTQILVSDNSSYESFVIENITPGTWTLQSSGSWTLSGMAVKVCSGSTCTDPEVIATVDNATVCAGAESTVTFTANHAADGATFQWQKKNGNTWENISEANSATYTISSVTTEHAGQYRVIAQNVCTRISEEVTLTVLTAPEFNDFAKTASVMKGNALAISDVQATNATDYTWYKSADATYDAGTDTKVGTSKELLLAASSITEEADQTFYLFCVASNSCGSVTSNAITVTVTPFIEEECATKGNEGEHEFGFTNTSCSQGTYSETAVWTTNSRSKYLTYTAPEGKYFKTAKVTVAVTSGSKCGYAYSTDGGTTWTYAELTSLSSTLTEKTINLSALGGGVIDAFRISRNLQDGGGTDHGVTSGNFHLSKACFEYADACTATTLTVGSYNNEYNISTHADFVEPTFTLKAGETPLENQTLTYTSSNPAIATVDEDGSVIFEGMTGKVTITVAFAGATINETEYCACQATYTITVGCTDRAPEIVAAAGTDLNGCNNSITLEAKMQGGTTSFTEGTFQWYRDGEAIDGATSASYEVVRAGTYTVSRTYTCTTMSSNSAVVTNENPEPKVERLTPFQYYHVNKTYSNQMKDRHLFAVTSYGTLDGGKRYHLTATRNGQTLDLSSSTAFFTKPSSDNAVDTVMIDLNALTDKYDEGDEIVITCAPINNCNEVSAITSSITIHVIGEKPTLALICSGAKEDGTGTRVTKEQMVGGDFLTGYNPADLCQQIGNTTFDPNTEWGFYTLLKEDYIVTPVNGYAQFNKLNYEPFDILLLTDYPKSSRSEAAQKIIDDMAELCDYRPLLSFKTHFQSADWKDKTTGEYKYTKWVKKGFTTAPVVPAQSALYADIVCYAHPMFSNINNTSYTYHNDADHDQLIYKILDRAGYEKKNKIAKGIQGFELADASNFVTIGLIHNDASAAEVDHTDADFNGDGIVDEKDIHKHVQWTNGENDRKLVAIAERQANVEARMILFSINCGAQSLQTEGGRQVILQCLKYLYNAENLIEPAECHLTFDNKHGDHKWSNHLNWAPRYEVCPTENDEVRIAAPCTVDITDASVLSVQILEGGSLTINQGAALVVAGPITRFDKETDISSATESEDILIGSDKNGNGTLIFSNANGTTKATVKMYSTAEADTENMSAAKSTWQYIGTPHSDVQNAADNYYESWLYQYDTGKEGWVVIPNGGPLVPFKGYCVTHPENPHTYTMTGTLTATTNQDITIPEGKFVVVANSWTAPIQVANFEDDDLENLTDKTVYLFNTGSDPEGDGTITPDASATQETRYAAGTYISIPIHSAPYTGDATISSMQGFYVVGGDAEGTLHLNYDKLVRPKEEQNIIGGPMHAPARIADTDNEPQVAKFLFRGTRYDDRLIILERPDFTRGYDSGWDGEQWGGNAAAPMSYVVAETRYDAVSAIPEYEGTVIGFRAGEDNIYTIHFDYDGMEEALYLLDTETKIYTRVLKGNSYTFACPDKAEHNRFILTRKAPQIATGTENIATGENAKAVKFIKDDKIFIFVNGILYDATGKMVIR